MRAVSLIEPLEDRIAPAAAMPSTIATVSPTGRSATYTDSTGDMVVVTTTAGVFAPDQFVFDPNTPGQLTELVLTKTTGFGGAAIKFTVIPVNGGPGGSSQVNVGYVDAVGIDLGSVTVPGDLGRIDVGGGATATALGSLTVDSLGALTTTQGGVTFPNNGLYDTTSNIVGTVGQVNVAGNLVGQFFAGDYKSMPGTGNIGQLTVGGSIDGSTIAINGTQQGISRGEVFFTGTLGTAVIGGGIEGGAGDFSGTIGGYASINGGLGSLSKIGSITVKGTVPDDPNPNPLPGVVGTSILGGSGALSGGIIADTIGSVKVAGDVLGGTGTASGFIEGSLHLGSVTVGGSLVGGNAVTGAPSEASSAGLIFGASIGTVTIDHNIYGGSGIQSGEILSTGYIQKVLVLGDMDGGSAGTASSTGFSGSIRGHVIGNITIMGSLNGGNQVQGDMNQAGSGGGVISSDTSIGSIHIGQNINGGSGSGSGVITTLAGRVGTITVAGMNGLVGGAGASSGSFAIDGVLGKLSLTGNVTGGSGTGSGLIQVNGNVNSLAIGGSVTGGTADDTGIVSIFGLLNSASIGKNVTGSSSGATKLTDTGYVQVNQIGALTVGGALTAGTAGAGGLDTSGAIRSMTTIGSLTVGSLVGNATNPAVISAVGPANLAANATTDVAIGSVTVKGNATYGDILAGYNTNTDNGTMPLGTGVNANAQIGTVTIGGNLTATNIVAGVAAGTGGQFGTATSAALGGAGVTDNLSILSKISRIVIKGSVTAPATATADTYGIVAQYIASATVDGKVEALKAGPDNDTFANAADITLLAGGNGNVVLYEV